jgi:hypothetical protein
MVHTYLLLPKDDEDRIAMAHMEKVTFIVELLRLPKNKVRSICRKLSFRQ